MSDAIEDAMNLILPVLQAAHGTIIQKAGQLPLHPALLKAVRKLGGKLQLTIAYKDPLKGSYMQQIGWDISDPNEMCALAILAAPLYRTSRSNSCCSFITMSGCCDFGL